MAGSPSGPPHQNHHPSASQVNSPPAQTAVPGTRKKMVIRASGGGLTTRAGGASAFAPTSLDTTASNGGGIGAPTTTRGNTRDGTLRSQANQSLITMKSLNEAEIFDKDINSIAKIVSGIEKDFQFDKLNENFRMKKLNIAQNMQGIAIQSPTNTSTYL